MDDQSTEATERLSIVLPAFNEAATIGTVVTRLRKSFPHAEVLVVDDGSSDATSAEANAAGARVVRHAYNMGNGAAIKSGARHASGDLLVFMDADGQHDDRDIGRLLEKVDEGYELVIGARAADTQASIGRWFGNGLLNRFATLITGRKIEDLTSGFRAARGETFRQFLYLLPNGFSYPTTTTMAYMRSGYPVTFIPIRARARFGKSNINLIRDGIRFLVIIMKLATLFSPMRFFLPVSLMFFLIGLSRYLYFYLTSGRFSMMAGVFFTTSVLIFLIGLISEQITNVHYGISLAKSREHD